MRTVFTLAFSLLLVSTQAQPLVYDFLQSEGGVNNAETRNDLVKDSNGNLILMGDLSGTQTIGGMAVIASGFTDVFVAKFDANGGLLWAVTGGDTQSFANGGAITVDANDDVYVTGKYLGNFSMGTNTVSSLGNSDIFVAKINGSTGAIIWLESAGGNSIDEALGITHVGNNEIVITGAYAGSVDFGSINLNSGVISNINIFAAKYSATGTVLWAVDAGGSNEDKGLSATSNGTDLYVAGYFQGSASIFGTSLSSAGANDIFLAKINISNGTGIWAKKAGGISTDQANDISVNNAGDIYMTGIFYNTATFGSINITEPNMVGEMYIAKYNDQGTALWVQKGGGASQDKGNGVSAEPNGSVYVTGLFAGNANFSGQTISASGPSDAFYAKYDGNGGLIWVGKGGGSNNDQGKALCAGANGIVCVSGSFSGTGTFGTGGSISAGAGVWDTYFACIDGGTVGLPESFASVGLSFAPNPVSTECQVIFSEGLKGTAELTIYSITGSKVKSVTFSNVSRSGKVVVDVSDLNSGAYILKISSDSYEASTQILID